MRVCVCLNSEADDERSRLTKHRLHSAADMRCLEVSWTQKQNLHALTVFAHTAIHGHTHTRLTGCLIECSVLFISTTI